MANTLPSMIPGEWPVYGHTWAVRLLQSVLHPETPTAGNRRLSHAYLVLGAPQVGKTTFARAFAMALLCSNRQRSPCYTCRSCQLMAANSHPDFRILQPTVRADKEFVVDRQKGELRAEQAETLIRDVALRPMEGLRKVFLIQDMHLANPTFANKILKTLEEPPAHSILLVTARHRAELLSTIVSRCQVIELRPLDQPVIVGALQHGWQASAQEADLLARLCGGRLGWAVDQLHTPGRREERIEHLQLLWRLISADRLERLRFAGEMAMQRDNQRLFSMLETWISWWRDVLLTQSECGDACSNVDQRDRIALHAQAIDQRVVCDYLLKLKRIEGYLRHTVNARLALDVLLLNLPTLQQSA